MAAVDRRTLLRLAGASTLTAAMAGAVRAEGGLLDVLGDAENAVPYAHRTPIRIGRAALRVRQLEPMTAFYRDIIGLEVLDLRTDAAVLGADGTALLDLNARPEAPFERPDQAGLYHIAFLMPKRVELARWLVHAAYTKVPLTGFSDHSVSEAIYLNDPEGNGLEVYSDRPADMWRRDGDMIAMGTYQLDVDDILTLTDTSRDDYTTAPKGLRIGHMHLKIGEVQQGRAFYETALGLASTRGNREDSAFLSSGGYHHHLALNIWNSAGAGQRDTATTGLDWFSLEATEPGIIEGQAERLRAAGRPVERKAGSLETVDPWGTAVRLVGV